MSTIHVVNTETHSNFDYKTRYVSTILNLFMKLVMETHFQHSGT
jgi:hypothetical protein